MKKSKNQPGIGPKHARWRKKEGFQKCNKEQVSETWLFVTKYPRREESARETMVICHANAALLGPKQVNMAVFEAKNLVPNFDTTKTWVIEANYIAQGSACARTKPW